MASADVKPIIEDRDVVRGFLTGRTHEFPVTCRAMNRLVEGTATGEDRDTLSMFIAYEGQRFPITADALARLLNKGE